MAKYKVGGSFGSRYSLGSGFIGRYPNAALPSLLPSIATGTTAFDADLDQMQVVNNAGSWVSISAGFSWSRTLIVSASGGTHTSIADAITAANALTPTPTTPVNIIVQAGNYVENNPLTVPSNVNIVSGGGNVVVRVVAAVNTSPIFIMDTDSSLIGLSLTKADGVGGVGVQVSGGKTGVVLQQLAITNCEIGLDIDGLGTVTFANDIVVFKNTGETINDGIYVHNQAVLNAHGLYILGDGGDPSPMNRGVFVEDANTICFLNDITIQSVDYGLSVDNNATLNADSGQVISTNYGGHIGLNGTFSVLHLDTIMISNSGVDDIYIENVSSIFRPHMCTFSSTAYNHPAPGVNSSWIGIYADENPLGQQTRTLGDITIEGSAVIGSGDGEIRPDPVSGAIAGNDLTLGGGDSEDGDSGNVFLEPGEATGTGESGDVVVQIGYALNQYASLIGKAYVTTTAVATPADTLQHDLLTYTLPAYALGKLQQGIRIKAWGTTAANANNKTVTLDFGSSSFSTGAIAANNKDWVLEMLVFRTGGATQDILAEGNYNGAAVQPNFFTGAEDNTIPIEVKVTGQNAVASANDIVAEGMLIEIIN